MIPLPLGILAVDVPAPAAGRDGGESDRGDRRSPPELNPEAGERASERNRAAHPAPPGLSAPFPEAQPTLRSAVRAFSASRLRTSTV